MHFQCEPVSKNRKVLGDELWESSIVLDRPVTQSLFVMRSPVCSHAKGLDLLRGWCYKRHEIKGFILGACTKGYGYDQKAVTYTLADPVQDSLSLAIL